MDMDYTQQSLNNIGQIVPDSSEQPIDCEFTLPDYCPDVDRILKCTVNTRITDYSYQQTAVGIDGTSFVNILYSAKGNGQLRGYEIPVNFSKSFVIPDCGDGLYILPSVKNNYVNCRAVNERKIEVHGAISVAICAYVPQRTDIAAESGEKHLQMKINRAEASSICGHSVKKVAVNEEMELPSGSPPIQNIIRYDVYAVSDDCKFVANKAIIKGELCVDMLYLGESGGYEHFSSRVPISQIVDADGVDEGADPVMRISVATCELKPYSNGEGECRSIILSAKLCVSLCGYKNEPIEYATDAYSTEFEITSHTDSTAYEQLLCRCFEKIQLRDELSSPSSISSVVDVWCIPNSLSVVKSDNGVKEAGSVLFCAVAVDDDGRCFYFEKTVPVEYQLSGEESKGAVISDAAVEVGRCSYNITGNDTVDVHCEITVKGLVFDRITTDMITSIESAGNEKDTSSRHALTVYFADEGENIWDIAKKYNAPIEKVMVQNKLENMTLKEPKMLLLPAM